MSAPNLSNAIREFVARVEAFLDETHISATAFGEKAVGDGNLVTELRAGREPRAGTIERVEAFMEKNRKFPVSRETEQAT